jgi:hypothetical protein
VKLLQFPHEIEFEEWSGHRRRDSARRGSCRRKATKCLCSSRKRSRFPVSVSRTAFVILHEPFDITFVLPSHAVHYM